MGEREDLSKSMPNFNQENELLNRKNEQAWIYNNVGPMEYTEKGTETETSDHGFSEQDKYVNIYELNDEELLTELTRHQNARNYYYHNQDFDEMHSWQTRLDLLIQDAEDRGLISKGQSR